MSDGFAEVVESVASVRRAQEESDRQQADQERREEDAAAAEIARTGKLVADLLTAKGVPTTVLVRRSEVQTSRGLSRSRRTTSRVLVEGWAFAHEVAKHESDPNSRTNRLHAVYGFTPIMSRWHTFEGYILATDGQVHHCARRRVEWLGYAIIELEEHERWNSFIDGGGPLTRGSLRGLRPAVIQGLAELAVESGISADELKPKY